MAGVGNRRKRTVEDEVLVVSNQNRCGLCSVVSGGGSLLIVYSFQRDCQTQEGGVS